jgi:hypothetical protein
MTNFKTDFTKLDLILASIDSILIAIDLILGSIIVQTARDRR